MNIENLIKMANQIGQFFESQPNREQALDDLSNHLLKFWEPRMKQQLIAHFEQTKESGLSDIVTQSLLKNRDLFKK